MKPKFLSPPDELGGVLDTSAATPRRKKKLKLRLMRREHTASPHVLNLKETQSTQEKFVTVIKTNTLKHEKPPISLTIHLDAERTITALRAWYSNWKTTLAFLVIGFLCIFGLRAINWLADVRREDLSVVAQSKEGVNLLQQGAQMLLTNPSMAAVKFQSSLHQFLWAKDDLKRFKNFHLTLFGKDKIDAALSLSRALKEVTVALGLLGKAAEQGVLESLALTRPHLAAALHYTNEALRFESGRAEIKELRNLISEQLLLVDDLAILLGRDQWKRYLVLFQNDTELRATGGFIGSFAVLDIDRGKIKNIEIPKGGSYDLQGQLTAVGAPPRALQLVKSRWEFQDANWFPDFPTSAKKIAWFYENAGGRTVDGVIALNTNLMIDLLKITGPIAMPAYKRTIDSNNFLLETQKIVELEYDKKANAPKAFIGDLAKEMIIRFETLPHDQYGKVMQLLLANLENKNISIYAADTKIEQHIKELGFSGAMHQSEPGEDYVSVVHTNIAGQKTDQVIKEIVNYEPQVAADGTTTVKLTITRAHGGKKGELFRGVRNVDFARIYVPAGATLISATGFEQPPANLFKDPTSASADQKSVVVEENAFAVDLKSQTLIYNQFGKTVFANWLQVDPGKTTAAVLTYKLPTKFTDQYQLYIEKQSGMRPVDFNLNLKYENNRVQMANDQKNAELKNVTQEFKLENDKKIDISLK